MADFISNDNSNMHHFASFRTKKSGGGGRGVEPPATAFSLSSVGMYDTNVYHLQISSSLQEKDLQIWSVMFQPIGTAHCQR